jgi:hypothetical protein
MLSEMRLALLTPQMVTWRMLNADREVFGKAVLLKTLRRVGIKQEWRPLRTISKQLSERVSEEAVMGTVTPYETKAGRRWRVRYRTPEHRQTDKRGFKTRRDRLLRRFGMPARRRGRAVPHQPRRTRRNSSS